MSKHSQPTQNELRNTALNMAIMTRKDNPPTPKKVVKAAEIYYEFLADEDEEWEYEE